MRLYSRPLSDDWCAYMPQPRSGVVQSTEMYASLGGGSTCQPTTCMYAVIAEHLSSLPPAFHAFFFCSSFYSQKKSSWHLVPRALLLLFAGAPSWTPCLHGFP